MESAATAGAVPSHIANSARNLFRECLRRADYIGRMVCGEGFTLLASGGGLRKCKARLPSFNLDKNGTNNGNREIIMSLIRKEFRKNMHETDPEKIKEQKEAAVRGLFNHMFYEAWSMSTGQADEF
ncbi:hypothetical protein O6H91_14G070000 [Diphasiastrum complanatum]|uniref:Uncharacterized protein n=1 Tax=Diphasiastrum complanatum TaxID=34168 RepID=A0ACC2BQI3_DIPCM|nr:hypothetical protein O6H91_14G070000 [Diphasiastrum complanatum]